MRLSNRKKRLQITLVVLLVITICLFVRFPVLTVSDQGETMVFYARPGEEISFTFFHSLYHVPQTEFWVIEKTGSLRLDRIYFGCYAAVLYYNLDTLPGLVRLSDDGQGDGEFMLYYDNYTSQQVLLHVSPTSKFEMGFRGRVLPLFSMLKGGTIIKFEKVSIFDLLTLKDKVVSFPFL